MLNKHLKYIISFQSIIILLVTLNVANAQNVPYTEYNIKAAIILKIAQNLGWKNTTKQETFSIAVVDDNNSTVADIFINYFNGKEIYGKPITVYSTNYHDIDKLDVNIIFLLEKHNSEILEAIKYLKGKNTLLITENLKNKKNIMINFKIVNRKVKFDINSENIYNQSITIQANIIKIGGDIVDIKKLNQYLEKRMEAKADSMKRLNTTLAKVKADQIKLNRQNKNLKKNIQNYQKQLDSIKNKSAEVEENLQQKIDLIAEKQIEIREKEKDLEELKADRENYRLAISKQQQTLRKTKLTIKNNDKTIKSQDHTIKSQARTIKKQSKSSDEDQIIKLMLMAILTIVIAFVFFMIKNHKKIRRYNKGLKTKTQELKQQKLQLQKARDNSQAKHEQIQAGIRYAKTIQFAVLKSEKDVTALFDSFLIYKAQNYVSGDFFWAKRIEKNQKIYKFAAVIDCTGHGVPAAFMTFVGNEILNKVIISYRETDTIKIMNFLHKKVYNLFKDTKNSHDGMVLSLMRTEEADDNNTKVTITSAKQAVYIKHPCNDKIIRLKGDIKEIGNPHYNQVKFTQHKFTLPKDTMIYMLSDGIIDQNNINGKKFGSPRLRKLLQSIAHETLDNQKSIINHELAEFKQSTEQRDDITLMGIKL